MGARPSLPGGYKIGETVFFTGAEQDLVNADGKHVGDSLTYGLPGTVVGVSAPSADDALGCSSPRLGVRFQGHKEHTNVRQREIAREKRILPGYFKIGDRVHWIMGGETLLGGDRLNFGMVGEVVGRATSGSGVGIVDDCVAVRFQGCRNIIDVLVNEISRYAPGHPNEGLMPGDRVFFSGAAQTFADGDRLDFGREGVVDSRGMMCPTSRWAGSLVSPRGEHIVVRFRGNKNCSAVRLGELSRTPPELPGSLRVGDRVRWVGGRRRLNDGKWLENGNVGQVMGRAAMRDDGKDEERVVVRFDGRQQFTPVGLANLVLDDDDDIIDVKPGKPLVQKSIASRFW